jgi:hypothetical protein
VTAAHALELLVAVWEKLVLPAARDTPLVLVPQNTHWSFPRVPSAADVDVIYP